MANRVYGGKKTTRKKSQTLIGVPEPQRESLLDILCENLEQAKKNIYVNRIIYLGEHSFESDGPDGISDVFREVINEINSGYNDEPLTGIFLHYKKYFVHMLEGSEDSIMKHFHLLMDDDVHNKLSKTKLVLVVNHINQRFVREWMDIPGKPATLLEKIDPDCDMEKSGRYIFNCVQKVYQLCREIREMKTKNEDDEDSLDLRKPTEPSSVSFDSSFYEEVLKAYYPEINLLQFLVQTRFLKDLEDYINIDGCPVVADSYQDEVWPIPSTMVPYTVFEKPRDPCVDLPTHKVEQVEEIVLDDETQIEMTEQQ
ncbi:uncharacterized protein LOC123316272 [Coccinella septempunctata]|uniref:uncharacterized protein LOC123316272 n=1 Tax=Coccinella septempunctata TaxID=41139 RepID=UPI001D07F8A6|nr:uncharacterized protein LOC123316272 [Coccinella septempunctata]